MCRIFDYHAKRVIYFWPISVNFHWAISAPIISRHSRWIISKRELHSSCAEIQPFEQRRGIMSARQHGTPEGHYVFPACCRGEHLCLLSVRPKFRLDYSLGFGQLFNRLYFASFFSRTVSYVFLCFGGNSLIDRLSTALVSNISQWSRACCMLRIFDWATAWIDCSQAHLHSRVIAVFLVFYRTFTDRLAAASDAY